MGNRTGGGLRVVIGEESAFNSGNATPVGYSIPKASCSIGWTEEFAASDELRDDPNPAIPIRGLWTVSGDLVQAVETDGVGRVAKYFLTKYTKTGTATPYTHEFKVSTTTPTSIWMELGDTVEGRYDRFLGCLPTGLRVTATKRAEVVKATWTIMGSGSKTLNTNASYDTSVDTYTALRHYLTDATLMIGDVTSALITDVDFTVQRTIEMPQVLDGNRYAASFAAGGYEVSGTITGLWDAADTLRGYVGSDSEVDLKLTFPRPGAPTKYVRFHFPEVKLGATAAPSITTRGLASMALDFRGYYADNTSLTSASFGIICVNDVSTSY
jgi:hypothetical protein